MARNTYWARMLLAGDDIFAAEQPTTAIAGHPYHELPMCLAVHNHVGSGKIVRVHQANVKPVTTGQSLVGLIKFTRITAASVGLEAIDAFPYDTGNTALPSQVEALYMPTSVTKTANSELRRMAMQPMLNFTRALSALVGRTYGDGRSGNDSSEVFSETDADTTGWILREGQGICLENQTTDLNPVNAFAINMVVNVGGETWRYSRVIEPRVWHNTSGALFSLMNNTGSGVVVDVQRVQIREIGTDEVPQVYFEPLDYIDPAGENAELVAFDDSALPSGISCKRNVYAQRRGAKYGSFISIPMIRRVQLQEPPWYPGLAGLQFGRRGMFERDVDQVGDGQLILNEGEGFGIRKSNSSSMVCHDAYIMFSVADRPIMHNSPILALGGMP